MNNINKIKFELKKDTLFIYPKDDIEVQVLLKEDLKSIFSKRKIDRIWNIIKSFQDKHLKDIHVLTFSNRYFDDYDDLKILKLWSNDEKLIIETSYFIGSIYSDDKSVCIQVVPRYGKNWFYCLLNNITNYYSIQEISDIQSSGESGSLTLFSIIWLALARQALSFGILREYKSISRNILGYKGKINIKNHLAQNLFDKRFNYCNYWELSPNTDLNQLLCYISHILSNLLFSINPKLSKQCKDYYEEFVNAGVEFKYDREWINKHWPSNSLNFRFYSITVLSVLFLKNSFGIEDKLNSDSLPIFIDLSELWELYVSNWLDESIKECSIINLNNDIERQKKFLLKKTTDGKEYFKLIPDIIIEKGGKIIGIIDAKYKATSIKPHINFGIKREDIYQLNSYLSRYNIAEHSDIQFAGLIYPTNLEDKWSGEDIYFYPDQINQFPKFFFQRVNPEINNCLLLNNL